MSALQIAILMGGASAEAEVSRNSAKQVAAALQQANHQVRCIEVDRHCATELLAMAPDVVFPALHGPPGEDGTVQGLLEVLELPYVGSGVRGSALAMDKAVAKSIFRQAGLPVAEQVVVHRREPDLDRQATIIQQQLGPSVVIKPLGQGSAIGVTPLPNGGDIAQALRTALTYGDCLVEPYVLGKEVTVGVLQAGKQLLAHPSIEIVTAHDEWYDYNNRYTVGKSEHIIPARVPANIQTSLQDIALRAHQALDLRDLSRADFIVTDDNQIVLLEVNTLPGMTPTSLYPDGAAHLGYSFTQLVDHLVCQAYDRRQA